jgi:membrane protease YdiL (CAAX protease family)
LGGAEKAPFAHQLYFLGAFGPAIGGLAALRLTSAGPKLAVGVPSFAVGAILAMVALLLSIVRDNPNSLVVLTWADVSPVTAPAGALLAVAIVLTSGFVFGSIGSPNATVASYFAGLKPSRKTLVYAIPVLLLMPGLGVIAYLVESAVNADADLPRAFETPVLQLLGIQLSGLIVIAVLTGGNEEHGWRGVLQPTLHRAMNPLLASVIILIVWDAWHMPLHATGFYGAEFSDPYLSFVLRLPNMALLTLLLAGIYILSRGSIFLCVLLHASYNASAQWFYTQSSSGYAIVIAVLVVLALIFVSKMYRRSSGYVPPEG